jgi:hypothetical protein
MRRNASQETNACTFMFITALFTIVKLRKQLRCPTTVEAGTTEGKILMGGQDEWRGLKRVNVANVLYIWV